MLTSVQFLSLKAAMALPPNANMAIISINGVGGDPAQLARCHAVLRLEFADMAEEWLSIPVGMVPDETRDGSRPVWMGEALPMIDDARRALSFIDTLARDTKPLELVVHCRAGISRSAAVALFVANHYGVPFAMPAPDTSGANPRMSRLLLKAQDGHELIIHDTAPDLDVLRAMALQTHQRISSHG